MRKTQILNIFNLIFLLCVILCLILIKIFFADHFYKTWYMTIVLAYAIGLYIKFWLFRSDNVLWFALVLTGIFVFMVCYNYFEIPVIQWPLLAQIPCIASGILYLIYRNHLHLYLNIMVNIIVSPLFLIVNNIGNIWLFLIAEILAVFFAIFVVNCINRKFRRE